MIYVLVEETGSYSAYAKKNLFASYNKAAVEARYKPLQDKRDRMVAAGNEMHSLRIRLYKDNPVPSSGAKKVKQEYDQMMATKLDDIQDQLAEKYHLEPNEVYNPELWYSIEEVESD